MLYIFVNTISIHLFIVVNTIYKRVCILPGKIFTGKIFTVSRNPILINFKITQTRVKS
jgi:hypothetical protein